MKSISPDNLTRILNTYAVVNPELDYCQGMNFIAGFLFMFLKDEATTFQVMKQVIKKYEMSLLFNTETPKLKMSFYTLDRLISILLPDLHSHLKVITKFYYWLLFRTKISIAAFIAVLSLLHCLRRQCKTKRAAETCGSCNAFGTTFWL